MTVRIILKAVKPNYTIATRYRVRLRKLMRAMSEDIIKNVNIAYRFDEKSVIGDAKLRLQPKEAINAELTENLHTVVKTQVGKWFQFFNVVAPVMAENFAGQVEQSVDIQLKSAFKEQKEDIAQQLTVGFSQANKEALQSSEILIRDNVNLINTIPQEYFGKIEAAVNQAMSMGRDRNYLVKQLKEIAGVTSKRAEIISKQQLRVATSAMDNERRLAMGITKSIWHHSGADKVPRPEHVKADGRVYEIAKGCPIKNEKGKLEYIQVGQKIGCTCWCESVIELE